MFNKRVYLALTMMIGLILIVSAAAAAETTKFKADFMEGSFVGDVDLEYNEKGKMSSYVDDKNGITYNISTVDDTDSLMKIYKSQGVSNPTKVTLNGNDWKIYFADAVPDTSNKKSDLMNIIICQSQGKKQGYLIYVIIDSDSNNVGPGIDTNSETYLKFVEPLLKSITLKKTNNIPKINEEFGLSEEEFQNHLDQLD